MVSQPKRWQNRSIMGTNYKMLVNEEPYCLETHIVEERRKIGDKMDNPNQYHTKGCEQNEAHEQGP